MTVNLLLESVKENLDNYIIQGKYFELVAEFSLFCELKFSNAIIDPVNDVYIEKKVIEYCVNYISHEVDLCKYEIDNSVKVVHVATRLYKFGGHSRLLEIINQGQFEGPIIQTDDIEKKSALWSKSRSSSRVQKLIKRLISSELVFLHIHGFDFEVIIACEYLKRRHGHKIIFINHADHTYSVGFHTADIILELSKPGWLLTDLKGFSHKKSFMGIPINGRNLDVGKQRKNIIFFGASPWKFASESDYNFSFFLKELAELFPNYEIRGAGVTGNEKIFKSLKKIPNIKFLGMLSSTEYKREIDNAIIYVDSFPYPGGTSFAQNITSGIASFGLQYRSGYSVIDYLKSNTVKDLIEEIKVFISNKNAYRNKLNHMIESVERMQATEVVLNRIANAIYGTNVDIPDEYNKCESGETSIKPTNKIILPLNTIAKLKFFRRMEILYKILLGKMMSDVGGKFVKQRFLISSILGFRL